MTGRERAGTGLLCTGRSPAQITAELWISANTLQDHLKSVFDKIGVRSRREVIATILRDHYLPGLKSSRQVNPAGYFARPTLVARTAGSAPGAASVPAGGGGGAAGGVARTCLGGTGWADGRSRRSRQPVRG